MVMKLIRRSQRRGSAVGAFLLGWLQLLVLQLPAAGWGWGRLIMAFGHITALGRMHVMAFGHMMAFGHITAFGRQNPDRSVLC